MDGKLAKGPLFDSVRLAKLENRVYRLNQIKETFHKDLRESDPINVSLAPDLREGVHDEEVFSPRLMALKVEDEDESKVNLAEEEVGMATLFRSSPEENRGAVQANPEVDVEISSHGGAEAAASGVDLDQPVDDGSDEAISTCEEEETSDEEGNPLVGEEIQNETVRNKIQGIAISKSSSVVSDLNDVCVDRNGLGIDLVSDVCVDRNGLGIKGKQVVEFRNQENLVCHVFDEMSDPHMVQGSVPPDALFSSVDACDKEGDLMGIAAHALQGSDVSLEACPGDAGVYGNRVINMAMGPQTWANVVATKGMPRPQDGE
ncbi:hypothetical protein U1Q18_017865 [Sarracenia purpurea var. burkii]